MARDLPVVVAGMCGSPRLIPAVSRDLGEALENSWGRVESGIELVVLYRRPVHDCTEDLAEGRRVGGERQRDARSQRWSIDFSLLGHMARVTMRARGTAGRYGAAVDGWSSGRKLWSGCGAWKEKGRICPRRMLGISGQDARGTA